MGLQESDAEDLVRRVRAMDAALHRYLVEMADNEFLPWRWLEEQVSSLAEELARETGHWHRASGDCMRDVPFELRMEALALLSAAWVTEIFLRKARDRAMPPMEARWLSWWTLLHGYVSRVQAVEIATRDYPSEVAYWRDRALGRRGGLRWRLRHWGNRLRWGR